jgi:hypothetical protein
MFADSELTYEYEYAGGAAEMLDKINKTAVLGLESDVDVSVYAEGGGVVSVL